MAIQRDLSRGFISRYLWRFHDVYLNRKLVFFIIVDKKRIANNIVTGKGSTWNYVFPQRGYYLWLKNLNNSYTAKCVVQNF